MSVIRLLALLTIVSHFGACSCGNSGAADDDGGSPAGMCSNGIDFDNDGFGQGCEAGEDCNDADPNLNVDCCGSGTPFTGCACDPATDGDVTCFDSDPSLVGVGVCAEGTRVCLDSGEWSTCMGSVLPSFEICDDGGDNDCDGQADEGVLSACDNCVPGCEDVGVDDDPFPLDDDDDGVGTNEDGDLVLNQRNVDTFFLWVANDGEGTVSKIDTRTGLEVARYPSVARDVRLVDPLDHLTGTPLGFNTDLWTPTTPGVAEWNQDLRGDGNQDQNPNNRVDNRPSRTAIDGNQDVWIANRAHDDAARPGGGEFQPTATKISNDPLDCIDWNGNGRIETSSDLNGDGLIDVDFTVPDAMDPSITLREFYAPTAGDPSIPYDECIAVTVAVGTVLANARALAIDAGTVDIDTGEPDPNDPGNAWVGMFHEQAFYRLTVDSTGGQAVAPTVRAARVALPSGHSPYGAAIDGNGVVWSPNSCCGGIPQLVGINSQTLDLVNEPGPDDGSPTIHELQPAGLAQDHQGSYGIVVDLLNNVWIAALYTNALYRYNPGTGAVDGIELSDNSIFYRTRGMAIDALGNVWAAIDREDTDGNTDTDNDGRDDLQQGNQSTVVAKAARLSADLSSGPQIFDLSTDPDARTAQLPVGIGVDLDGHIWTINQTSSNLSRMYIDPTTGEPGVDPAISKQIAVYDYDEAQGHATRPYTYSDFTGLSRRIVTNPDGTFREAIQGCVNEAANWLGISVDATTPANTEVRVSVKVGEDLATLGDALNPTYGPWIKNSTVNDFPIDLQAPPQGPVPSATYLLLIIELRTSDSEATPIVHGYDVQWTCPSGPIE